jgi:membrane protein
MNVSLRTAGAEPFHRSFVVGPLLLVAVLGLLWGAWASRLLIELVQLTTGAIDSRLSDTLVGGLMPLLLAVLYFAVILTLVPRTGLTRREIFVSALFGTVLWEAARHIFGWMVGSDSAYTRLFGPLGGVVALLAWVYVSSAILVLTGQFAWAYSMERRGRGLLATAAPREAGLDGWIRPFHGDNSVNEDHP